MKLFKLHAKMMKDYRLFSTNYRFDQKQWSTRESAMSGDESLEMQ